MYAEEYETKKGEKLLRSTNWKSNYSLLSLISLDISIVQDQFFYDPPEICPFFSVFRIAVVVNPFLAGKRTETKITYGHPIDLKELT